MAWISGQLSSAVYHVMTILLRNFLFLNYGNIVWKVFPAIYSVTKLFNELCYPCILSINSINTKYWLWV